MAEEFEVYRIDSLPMVSSVSDRDSLLIVQGGKPKRALPSLMKGPKGDSVKGNPGDSAYIDWKKQPGNANKSYADYQAWLQQPATDAAARADKKIVQISQDVNQAITNTNTATREATEAASNANKEASNLSNLKIAVTNATNLANEKAEEAEFQAAEAKIQAQYAKEQGELATAMEGRIIDLEDGKLDDITVENNRIYPVVNGELKGEGIEIPAGGGGGVVGLQYLLRANNNLDSKSLFASKGQPCYLNFTFVSQWKIQRALTPYAK